MNSRSTAASCVRPSRLARMIARASSDTSVLAFAGGLAADDLDAGRRAEARRARGHHLLGVLLRAHAARGLDAHLGAHRLAHQLHVLDRGAAAGEAGAGL